MTVAEGTRSRTKQGEVDGMATMLQEILRKPSVFENQLEAIENKSESRLEKGQGQEKMMGNWREG